jgi:hypothetical protein
MNKLKVEADNTADVEIANKVMHAMIVKGKTLGELSEATGIKPHTIRRSLHQDRADRRSFTFREFHKIAAALDVPPSVLVPATLTEDAA